MRLDNQVAIITGSGRGIGRTIALTFAEAGADIVLVSRTPAELAWVASAIRQKGRRVLAETADVSVQRDVQRVVAHTIETFGQIDILVNNAAVDDPKPFMETTPADWERVMAVNFTSVMLFTQAVLPHMQDRGQGKIINISSGAGLRGHPKDSLYAASKAAVNAFSQSLADEVKGDGIQVNVISPGPIRTQMTADPSYQEERPSPKPLLEPEDVASAALYLASKLSGRINAQIIHIRESNRW